MLSGCEVAPTNLPLLSINRGTNGDRVDADRVGPEQLIAPLQILKLQHVACLKMSILRQTRFGEIAADTLLRLLWSNWLRDEIDDVLCWAYEGATEAAKTRLQILGIVNSDGISQLSRRNNNVDVDISPDLELGQTNRATRKMSGKLRSHERIATPQGMLKVELSTAPGQEDLFPQSSAPWKICISSMAAARERTVGLSATFVHTINGSYNSRISASIRTFYVITLNSAIIRCVSENDLEGVQKLFI